jgi:hypothetical protein
MKWWQTGYWSLWRNETALHSPQSELDQGFLELQIVNDKSCATINLWRECGGLSFYVVQLMAPSTLMTVSVLCSVYFLSQFSSLGDQTQPIIRIFVEKKKSQNCLILRNFFFNHYIQTIGSNKLSKYIQIL